MGRKILGVFVGLAGGFAVILLLQAAGQVVWSLPEGLDPRDREAIVAALRAMPAAFLVWTAWSWLGGAFAGTYLALRLARDPEASWPALTVEAALLAMGVLNVAALGYPPWFWVVGLGAFPLGAFVGMRMARQRMEGVGE